MIRALRLGLRTLQRLVPPASGGFHVLGYHLVDAGTESPVDLPGATFQHQMERLAAGNRVLPLDQAVEGLGTEASGEPRVVLTFDDAYRNFHTHAFPLLERLGLPATVYVPTGFVEGECPAPLGGAPDLPAMSWSELRELAASGLITIGSHSHTHPDLRRLPSQAVRRELGTSKALLEDHLGAPVRHFCFPRALGSRRLEPLVAELFETAALAGGVINRPRRRRSLRLGRIPIRRDMPGELEPVLASGVWLEEWFASRLRRWRPSRPRLREPMP